MFGIGIILTISGFMIIFSDMVKDPVHNFLTLILPLTFGLVLMGISASFGLKKAGRFLSK